MIIFVDGESVAAGYITPSSLENVPEQKTVLKCENKGSSMVSVT